ncbi:MAG: GTPase HflX [Dinoroseobacter sp.]|nr:GTPase HflX [Dinoroseobacter sp.]
MSDYYEHGPQVTRGWVLHPELLNDRQRRNASFALQEAVSLADALPGFEVQGSEIVRISKPQPGHLVGSGKMEELADRLKANKVELVLVDGPLTPVQQRNLEKAWKVKILDRTGLILEIFADRAATREGVLQVELAALSYQRTRLVRSWTHLERQRGGLGFVGGPGETQIEADRRAIDDAATRIRRQLAKVVKTRELHRAARAKVPYPIVALVGYTNAGKSTLFNLLTGATVMAKDMLFATLDPTMRSVKLSNGTDVILSDTVGFISDLPTELVAAFRATLEEVLAADLICHVRDIAHPQTEEQAEDVKQILETLGVNEGIPTIEVWNKVDLLDEGSRDSVHQIASRREDVQVISAVSGAGIDDLVDAITTKIRPQSEQSRVFLGWADSKRRAWLFEKGLVLDETPLEDGAEFLVEWTEAQKVAFETMV